jgi:hypothetical protein
MNPEKMLIMMMAAAVTTRALAENPLTIASCGSAPATCSSRMRVTRNTS